MNHSENLHHMIFTSGCTDVDSPENAILKSVLDRTSDDFDKLFSAVQIYEYGVYLKTKMRKEYPNAIGLSFIVSVKINCLIVSILSKLDGCAHTQITMHRDEHELVERMFKSVISFYEGMEEFEKCAIAANVRDILQKRIKIC